MTQDEKNSLQVALLFICLLFEPIVMLVLSLIMFYKYRKTDRIWKQNGFRLNPEEGVRFKDASRAFNEAKKLEKQAEEAAENEGVTRKQNGDVSIRSYRGKELADAINTARDVQDNAKKIYNSIKKLPLKRWKSAKKHFSIGIASCVSLMPWLVLLIDILFDGDLISNIIGQQASTDPGMVFLYVAGCSLAIWVIAWLICLIIFRCKNRKPPMLDISNVDRYTRIDRSETIGA